MEGPATATGCSEMRHDPILHKWVIISPARGKRPTDFKSNTDTRQSQSQGPCAFCLNHEHECAPEIFRIPERTSAWIVRVIKNLYPALSMDHPSTQFSHRSPDPLHTTLTGFGSHDVVVETPEHSMTLACMPESSILHVLLAYKLRVQQLASNEIIKYIQVFKNHGVTAGASMRHSHSQIIGLPIVPTNVERRLNNAREYFIRTGKCNLCECLSKEIQSRCRFIEESAHFIAFVPYAASLPFETWIAPKEHASHYQEIEDEQAKMFNDASSEFDVLVASDAVGMGLNLNIRRIIFSTLEKFDGLEMRYLTVPEIKQIAGRAGRYGSMFPNGEVTCMSGDDLPLLHASLNAPSPCLEAAGLFPSFDLLALYSRLHPDCTFYSVLEHFVENAKLSSNYFISDCEAILKVAEVIEDLPLGLQERYLFCISPVDMDDGISSQGLIQFAEEYAKKGLVNLKKVFTPATFCIPKTQMELKELESIHKVLDLYVWLSFRMKEIFPDRELASSQKAVCGMMIEEYLESLGYETPKTKTKTKRGIKNPNIYVQ